MNRTVVIIEDDEADPFDWDGEGPMGRRAWGVGLTEPNSLTRPDYATFIWGIWLEDDTNYAGTYSAPSRVPESYLQECAEHAWKELQ